MFAGLVLSPSPPTIFRSGDRWKVLERFITSVDMHESFGFQDRSRAEPVFSLANATNCRVPRRECEHILGDNSSYPGRQNPWACALDICHVIGSPVDREGSVGDWSAKRARHYTIRHARFPEDHQSVCGSMREAAHANLDTTTNTALDDPLNLEPFADSLGGAILLACLVLCDGHDDDSESLVPRALAADRSTWRKFERGVSGISMGEEYYVPFELISRPLLEDIPIGIVGLSKYTNSDMLTYAGVRTGFLNFCYVSDIHSNLALQDLLLRHAIKTAKSKQYTKLLLDPQELSPNPESMFCNQRFQRIDVQRPQIMALDL